MYKLKRFGLIAALAAFVFALTYSAVDAKPAHATSVPLVVSYDQPATYWGAPVPGYHEVGLQTDPYNGQDRYVDVDCGVVEQHIFVPKSTGTAEFYYVSADAPLNCTAVVVGKKNETLSPVINFTATAP